MDVDSILEAHAVKEILQHLIDSDELHGDALGVARQVVGKGRDSLRGNQISTFERIEEEFIDIECRRCGCPLPISEVIAALIEEDGLCSWCRHAESKDD